MASRRGPDNSVRVAISGASSGESWTNVFYAQLTTGSVITQTDLDSWLTSVANAFKTMTAPYMANSTTYSSATAVLFAPGGGELISVAAMTGNGTGGAGVLPPSLAAIVSWVANVYWRGGKPRTYIGGLATTVSSDNHGLTTSTKSSLQTAAGTFRTTVNALAPATITGTQLGFVSFRSGNAERATPLFFAYVGARVHTRMGTQRRRLGRWQV